MDHFIYRSGALHIEGVNAHRIVERFGSPVYVYSAQTLRHHVAALQHAFAPVAPLICYSVKSCSNLSVLQLLVRQGCGMDVVSGGELQRALAAGARPETIVFAGVGKSADEIRLALEHGIFMFNAESEAEVERINSVAGQLGRRARIALRINPDVADAATPDKTATGGRHTKFGIPLTRALPLYRPGRYSHLDVCGVHIHLGSPIPDAATYVAGIAAIERLIYQVEGEGGRIDTVNIGGGFPASYVSGENQLTLAEMGRVISAKLAALHAQGKRIVIEPGRSISANAGVLLATVEYMKQGWDCGIAILDAGMNTLLRPAMYGARHVMWPVADAGTHGPWHLVAERAGAPVEAIDVAGPICETGDLFAQARPLPPLAAGDVLAIFSSGAYGMSMASQYNTRPRPAEVMVDGEVAWEIRAKEAVADLLALEMAGLRHAQDAGSGR
ncbi:diaminopimelate decarboxylase [Pseudoduganella ginsengisoli]|uniref:Diaminopimelate decarboxylase n=1 Tax=Pseudoduganella ginsengisoli TaxID=1462440 RepID=A0A6L6Q4L7_9BURK|nr:diaminopimelate decarboxylase [Pseudoduganella ginsengisoli]MTW04466.1 diaminopimelate decarboxylase [Pseudoduganella ginsengisoli]